MADELEPRAEDMHALAMAIRYDLTAAQSKLTELIRQVALVAPAVVTRCHLCGYRPAMNLPSLAEHLQRVHGVQTAELCPDCGLGGGRHTEECTTRGLVSRAHITPAEELERLESGEPEPPSRPDAPAP